jgi:hypothetical protein
VTDLWVMFLDGGRTLNLTESLDLDLQVRASIGGVDISPDGARIAVMARQRGDATPFFDTWTIPAPLGGQPFKLLSRGCDGRPTASALSRCGRVGSAAMS